MSKNEESNVIISQNKVIVDQREESPKKDEHKELISDDMKQRMKEMENKIILQSENLSKISELASKKEEKLNNDIQEYIKKIEALKSEMEVLNGTISHLTQEKEKNNFQISNLMDENQKLKKSQEENNKISQNLFDKNNNNLNTNLGVSSYSEDTSKKYEEIIKKLKKNIFGLKEEKKVLENIIFKQESKVSELSTQVDNAEKLLQKKDKELQDTIEYTAKLTSTINFHKKEIQKLKQNNSKSENLNLNVSNLQKEILNMKKELEKKDNKINLLSMNNKILQGKVNKLSIVNNLTINNNNNNNNNNVINLNGNNNISNNKNINSNINGTNFNTYQSQCHSTHINPLINNNNLNNAKFNINNSNTNLPNLNNNRVLNHINNQFHNNQSVGIGGRKNIENNKEFDNHGSVGKLLKKIEPKYNLLKKSSNNIDNNDNNNTNKQKLYIIAKSKQKSKTPGKMSKRKSPNCLCTENVKSENEEFSIKKSAYQLKKKDEFDIPNNKQINIKIKKDDSNKDTIFDDDLENINMKDEIISQKMLCTNEGGSLNINNNDKKIIKKEESSIARFPEIEYPIIESYCVLMESHNDLKEAKNNNYEQSEEKDESKIDEEQVQNLHDKVNQILDEFK